MTNNSQDSAWETAGALIGRLIFAAVFTMAFVFKLMNISGTAAVIAAAGFPVSTLLAWLAALYEIGLVVCFVTGVLFTEATLLAAAYVLFLAFAFHGPSHWNGSQTEFGFFVDHFTFIAGLMFAALHGPGSRLSIKFGLLGQRHNSGPG